MRWEAARMRKMMHLGAGVMLALCLLGAHAGGAGAGLGLWLCGSAACARPYAYPYPRKRRAHGSGLFFAWAAALLLLSVLFFAEKALLPLPGKGEHGLFCVGAACFSACAGGAALDAPLPPRLQGLFGLLMVACSAALYFL